MSCGEEEQEQEPEQGVAAELEWSKSYYHIMISPMSASWLGQGRKRANEL